MCIRDSYQPLDDINHCLRLALVWHGQDQFACLHNLADRHRNRHFRYVLQRRKPSLAHLLATAGLIEADSDLGLLSIEVGRRIVEGEVAILTNASKAYIDGLATNSRVETHHFALQVTSTTVDRNELCQGADTTDKALPEIAAKTRRMIGRDTDIFIKMEDYHLRPVDVLPDQRVQHFELAGTGCNDDRRVPIAGNRFTNRGCTLARSRDS